MAKKSKSGAVCVKFRVSQLLLLSIMVITHVLKIFIYYSNLNRLPAGSIGDVVLYSVKKGVQKLRKKVHLAVIIRQRRPWRRPDGAFI